MKKEFFLLSFMLFSSNLFSQIHTEQNGLKSSVLNLAANGQKAQKYEIANIGYNSYHWQSGGLIIVELFCSAYETGYEKYIIEQGYLQGAHGGQPTVKLTEVHGIAHGARITLGSSVDLNTEFGGYANKSTAVNLEIASYMSYNIKITYLQERVEQITGPNQIKINQIPVGITIDDFKIEDVLDVNLATTGNLLVKGSGNHIILNGNLGIGTTSPDSKLTVKGKIHAEEIKVDINVPAPDYVFHQDYKPLDLNEVETYVIANHHLPEIPSAAEMKKNGINVSDMNMKLLKKVEELTLYLIEQNKQMVIYQKSLNEMQKDIEILKNR
ncbi:hypothetical protein [Arcticibacter tournemirensis]